MQRSIKALSEYKEILIVLLACGTAIAAFPRRVEEDPVTLRQIAEKLDNINHKVDELTRVQDALARVQCATAKPQQLVLAGVVCKQ